MAQPMNPQNPVNKLMQLHFIDDTPNIEAMSPVLSYEGNDSLQFRDRLAFQDSPLSKEIELIDQFNQTTRSGHELVAMLYTHRSITNTITKTKNELDPPPNEEVTKEFYKLTSDLLEPLLQNARKLIKFRDDTTAYICSIIKSMITKKDVVISNCLLDALGKLIDSYIQVDLILNQKPSFSNDFSHYKRAFSIISSTEIESIQLVEEMHAISLFLANKYSLIHHLKTEISKIDGYEGILDMLLNYYLDKCENKLYLYPSEKDRQIRMIISCLIFVGDQKNEKKNPFKMKNIPNSRIGKILKKTPFLLLYGDMATKTDEFLTQVPFYTSSIWGPLEDKKTPTDYLLVNHIEEERTKNNKYISEFCHTIGEIKNQVINEEDLTSQQRTKVIDLLIRGLRQLSEWTSAIMEQTAFKYHHPTTVKCPTSTSDYEKVVRYNYTAKELNSFVEYIAMVKGLSDLLKKNESIFAYIIRSYIYTEIQEFVQNTIHPMIQKTAKKKKETFNKLLFIRTILADWIDEKVPLDPAVLGKKYKKPFNFRLKQVGITSTQFTLLLMLIENVHSVFDKKGAVVKTKQLSSAHVNQLREFSEKIWIFPYILQLGKTIHKCGDLGFLWFREFHLQLSDKIQFPVEHSLPWILAYHSLSLRTSHIAEMMLFPLSIYNDAAELTLSKLKQQFLFEEIQAEVDLCFDQLIFQMAEHIFVHYKHWSSTILLDPDYRAEISKVSKKEKLNPPKSRYDIILKQRHFKLLGRTINISKLLSQKMNNLIRENINNAIQRFEATNITGIVELEQLLEGIRYTHQLLSGYLEIDSFESMLKEIDETTSLVSLHGRIILHCISEFIDDLIPNFVYNSVTQRFIRSQISYVEKVLRDNPPKIPAEFLYGSEDMNQTFDKFNALTREFFGIPHILSMLRIIGEENLPLIAQECLTNVGLKIQNVLAPYVEELLSGISTKTNLPSLDYGIQGCFGYFDIPLKVIRDYEALDTDVFQNFREIGNTILLMRLFDQAMPQLRFRTFINSAPFLAIFPNSENKENENDQNPDENEPDEWIDVTETPRLIDDSNMNSNIYSTLSKSVEQLVVNLQKSSLGKSTKISNSLVSLSRQSEEIYRPLSKKMSLFKAALLHVNKMLDPVRSKWLGDSKPGLFNVDRSNEFYRLWSSLQFMFCLAPEKDPNAQTQEQLFSKQEIFGDGFAWAGSTIIHFLGQREVFDALDFSYHLIYVNNVLNDKSVSTEQKIFLQNAKIVQNLNNSIFGCLESYAPLDEVPVFHFEPPTDEEMKKISRETRGIIN
ncbi:cytoplasmic fmr1-interacting protein-related [Anaeramoeba ignava]|uniref:Cytoplasmic fmr1-interacting protein-related n=1 Tax=Anaeramoeba ignava TaxID=1746090 RepID=A0A9Q0LUV4_ANAIG|nr:cytoplasmic fmr1-interacting protein-related [Anaeramoeba ignava]